MFEFECSICGKHTIQRYRYYQNESLICNDCHRELLKKRPDIFCIECGKLITTSRVYKNKKGEPICRTCQLNQIYTDHYGSREEYSRIMQENRRKTLQSRYGEGIIHPMQLEEVKERIRRTNLERYGDVHNWGKNSTLRDGVTAKIREVQNSPDVKAKRKATNTEKYGGPSPFSSSEVRDKYQNTMLERYGVDHNWSKGELRERMQEDFRASHPGFDSWSQLPDVKEQIRQTCMERYGVENANQSPQVLAKTAEARKATRNTPEHIQWRIDYAVTYHNLGYVGQSVRDDGETVITYRCKTCGKELDWCQIDDPRHPFCQNPECISRHRSKMEIQLHEAILSIIPDEKVMAGDKTVLHGKELDIYVLSRKLAIEFDGLYWHDGKDNSYKYEECRKQGIRLIQITEYEWLNKRDIISSILRSAFGIFEHRVYARKCTVKELSDSTYREFLEENHLQGYAPASVRLGLYLGDDLVQVESFGKSRYSKGYEWELIRECSKQGYSIIGGKARLFRHFVKEHKPSSVISYCEKNKFSGDSYIKLGFKLDHESVPGYSYYKSNARYSRLQFQKHKMPDLVGSLLETFDENLTESENMSANGYTKLYDYGNFVFVWRTEKEQPDS